MTDDTQQQLPQHQALDPQLQDGGYEQLPEHVNASDSPESEEGAVDVSRATLDTQINYSIEYWRSAVDAKVLDKDREGSETFFRTGDAPPCLRDPRNDGHVALTTSSRRELMQHYQNDRAKEATGEPEHNVRTLAEIALVQAFADLALFKKLVLQKLTAVGNPYLQSSVRAGVGLSELHKTHAWVTQLADVHTDFAHYAAHTHELLRAYDEEFGDADGHRFIDQLNQELYLHANKGVRPANESGILSEFQGVYEVLLKQVHFSDILTKLEDVIALEQKSLQAKTADQQEGAAVADGTSDQRPADEQGTQEVDPQLIAARQALHDDFAQMAADAPAEASSDGEPDVDVEVPTEENPDEKAD